MAPLILSRYDRSSFLYDTYAEAGKCYPMVFFAKGPVIYDFPLFLFMTSSRQHMYGSIPIVLVESSRTMEDMNAISPHM